MLSTVYLPFDILFILLNASFKIYFESIYNESCDDNAKKKAFFPTVYHHSSVGTFLISLVSVILISVKLRTFLSGCLNPFFIILKEVEGLFKFSMLVLLLFFSFSFIFYEKTDEKAFSIVSSSSTLMSVTLSLIFIQSFFFYFFDFFTNTLICFV